MIEAIVRASIHSHLSDFCRMQRLLPSSRWP